MKNKENTSRIVNKLLCSKNYNKVKLIAEIMTDSTYEELNYIYSKVPKLHKGLFSLPYLRCKSYELIFKRGYYLNNTSIENYVGVVLFVVEKNKNIINKYLDLRDKYENALLLGKYNLACQFLSEINNSVSYSVWAAEQEVKLIRQYQGIQACSDFVEQLSKAKFKLGFYSSYYFKTSSIDCPFDTEVNFWYKNLIRNSALGDAFSDALMNHTCAYMQEYKSEDWIYECSQSSIIDLYNSVRDNLWLFKSKTASSESFKKYISLWATIFEDSVVKKYVSINRINTSIKLNSTHRDKIISLYYEEMFDSVIQEAKDYLLNKPTDFAIMEMMVKSKVYTNIPIENVKDDSCIFEKVVYHYHNLLSGDSTFLLHLNKLVIICRSLYSIQSFRYLYEIINNYRNTNPQNLDGECYKYSPFGNFTDVKFFESKSQRLAYLEDCEIGSVHNNFEGIVNATIKDNDLCHIRYSCLDNVEYQKKLKDEWGCDNVPQHLRSSVASFLFNEYVRESRWQEAVLFYVDAKLKNASLEIHYDEKKLHASLAKEVLTDLDIPLEMSIFYSMIDYTAAKKYLSYKHYLKQLGINRASELEITNDSKVLYFLQYVANKKVMGLHRAQFRTADQVTEERIKICNNLYSFQPQKRILNEITELIKEQQVKKLIQRVDESRIYVDEEGIRTNELSDEASLFALYKATDESIMYSESGIGILLDFLRDSDLSTNKKTQIVNRVYENESKIRYKESLFSQIYLGIRDSYLLNAKYGLDFHLSTRIRHGALVNQLRMHFEQHSLVTNIVDNNNYAVNTFWTDCVLHLEGEEKRRCQELLQEFTSKVDKSIMRIKNEYVQIKTENRIQKSKAAFNFSFENLQYGISYLAQYCADKDFHTCVSSIFSHLWRVTEESIKYLKLMIEDEKNYMLQELSLLNKALIKAVNRKEEKINQLTTAITRCSTELQSDFAIVNGWLQRRNLVEFEFNMQNVIDTCTTVINNMNNGGLHINETNKSTSRLKGLYFNYIYDILNNVFNNVLSYQKKIQEEIMCSVEIEEEEDKLLLKISNNIRQEDIDDIQKEITRAESNCENYVQTGQVTDEGKTGISKVYNVVKYILNHPDNYYKNNIDKELLTVTTKICLNIRKIRL